MTETEVQIVIDRYNSLLSSSSYWIEGGMRLVEHLHEAGMKYRDIYAIMEKEPSEAPS